MKNGWAILRPFVAVLVGLFLGGLVAAVGGENPFHVLGIIFHASFSSWENIGMTLFYTTPLIFTGLSVAFAFQSGLFNIGAEGQLHWGAMAAVAIGILMPTLPFPVAVVMATLAAFVAGGLWGGIAGYIRAWRGGHEVISTIMLNAIAIGLTSWLTLYVFKDKTTQSPETISIPTNWMFKNYALFGGDAPVNAGIFVGIFASVFVWWFLNRTATGFSIRAVGQNEHASRVAGISTQKMRFLSLFLAGGLSGLVGLTEIFGTAGKFRLGFSNDAGFTGIAVAFLARCHPLAVLPAALLFGVLQKGSMDLDFETETVSKDLSLVLQALVILAVAADGLWDMVQKRKKVRHA